MFDFLIPWLLRSQGATRLRKESQVSTRFGKLSPEMDFELTAVHDLTTQIEALDRQIEALLARGKHEDAQPLLNERAAKEAQLRQVRERYDAEVARRDGAGNR
jgi:hypothetical protein